MHVHSDPGERDGQKQHFDLGQGWLLEALQAAGCWPPAECTTLDASWRHGGPSRPRARVSRARRAIHPQGCRGPHALRNKWRACIRKVPVEKNDRAMARRIVFSHLDDMAARPEAADASLQRMLRALRARTAVMRCVHVSPALPLCSAAINRRSVALSGAQQHLAAPGKRPAALGSARKPPAALSSATQRSAALNRRSVAFSSARQRSAALGSPQQR